MTIKTVSGRGNLTTIGVRLTECFDEVRAEDETTALSFDDLSTLFQYADSRTVTQFFQVLTNHTASHDVKAHNHVHPGAVDDTELNRLKIFADAVVRPDDGGDCRVLR